MEEEAPLPEEEVEEERKNIKVTVQRMIVPMSSRSQSEVMKHIVDLYLSLRADGYIVSQIHTDNAGEFRSRALSTWCYQNHLAHLHSR